MDFKNNYPKLKFFNEILSYTCVSATDMDKLAIKFSIQHVKYIKKKQKNNKLYVHIRDVYSELKDI